MKNKSKSILGISLVITCIFIATSVLTACNNQTQKGTDSQLAQGTDSPQPTITDASATDSKAPVSKDSGSSAKTTISEGEAKRIALEHAGVKEADTKRFRIELDYDDGRYVYEIEFDSNSLEYDYDINAETGEIIEFSKERD